MVERRIKAACFPVIKSLDSFDFKVIPFRNGAVPVKLRFSINHRRETMVRSRSLGACGRLYPQVWCGSFRRQRGAGSRLGDCNASLVL